MGRWRLRHLHRAGAGRDHTFKVGDKLSCSQRGRAPGAGFQGRGLKLGGGWGRTGTMVNGWASFLPLAPPAPLLLPPTLPGLRGNSV